METEHVLRFAPTVEGFDDAVTAMRRYDDRPVSGAAPRPVQSIAVRRSCRLVVSLVLVAVACGPASAQTVDRGPTPGRILEDIPRDLWKFLSWDTAIVLGIGGGTALAVHPWDDDLAGELETNVRLNDAMEPGHTYGAFGAQALIGVGLYTGGRLAKKGRLAQTGADIIRAQILSQAYVQAIKFTVQRERPDGSNSVSFPSGHSASAFATATVLQRHYGWKVGVPAAVLAAYVATARVHDNKHYLSDVVFGAAMGIAAQRTVTLHSRRYDMAMVPAAGAGYASVTFTVRTR